MPTKNQLIEELEQLKTEYATYVEDNEKNLSIMEQQLFDARKDYDEIYAQLKTCRDYNIFLRSVIHHYQGAIRADNTADALCRALLRERGL